MNNELNTKKWDEMSDLERLQTLVGNEFDEDEVICAMIDKEDEYVQVSDLHRVSNFDGHGECKEYQAYYEESDDEGYNIFVDNNNIIVEIK